MKLNTITRKLAVSILVISLAAISIQAGDIINPPKRPAQIVPPKITYVGDIINLPKRPQQTVLPIVTGDVNLLQSQADDYYAQLWPSLTQIFVTLF